jgi:hypothetical protein
VSCNPIIPDITRDVFIPAVPRRKASLSGLPTSQPKRKACHPKGRNAVQDARSALTSLERRLLRDSNHLDLTHKFSGRPKKVAGLLGFDLESGKNS